MSKILTDKATVKLALEAAYLAGWNASGEGYNAEYPFGDHARNPEEDAVWIKDRDNALQEALAEQPAQQEPVAFCDPSDPNARTAFSWPGFDRQPHHTATLCATPQPAQRTWVGLTHEEHMEIMTGTMTTSSRMAAVEAKLKEKNT